MHQRSDLLVQPQLVEVPNSSSNDVLLLIICELVDLRANKDRVGRDIKQALISRGLSIKRVAHTHRTEEVMRATNKSSTQNMDQQATA